MCSSDLMGLPSMANPDFFLKIRRKLRSYARWLRKVPEGLWVMTPVNLPLYGSKVGRWLNRVLLELGVADSPVRLIHNYWGVMLSLVISGFPFTFLLTLSYVTGIDPALEQAGAMLGARARQRFFRILLPLLAPGLAITLALAFVQAFTVFPSAVLLGAPAGPTRVISIVAYQAAFEQYDYPLASAIAMLMAGVQVLIIVALLGARTLVFRGPVSTGKG